MTETSRDGAPRSGVRVGLVVGAGIVLLAGGYWLVSGGSGGFAESPGAGTPSATTASASQSPGGEAAPGVRRPAHMVEPGRKLRVAGANLTAGESLELGLSLPVRHEGEEPLWARIVAQGRDPYETEGVLAGGDGTFARLDVPPEWLVPGTYLIELKVREQTPLPLRRYVLEID